MNKSEIPRNEFDWEGGVVLLDPVTKVFYLIGFGNGTNADDLCEGCDDYLYLEYGHLIRNEIQDEDGGQLDFNRERSHYDGDIRNAIDDALEFLGVSVDVSERLIYISNYR